MLAAQYSEFSTHWESFIEAHTKIQRRYLHIPVLVPALLKYRSKKHLEDRMFTVRELPSSFDDA
jgi:hypothetical protein